jgi:hypothetical protein
MPTNRSAKTRITFLNETIPAVDHVPVCLRQQARNRPDASRMPQIVMRLISEAMGMALVVALVAGLFFSAASLPDAVRQAREPVYAQVPPPR